MTDRMAVPASGSFAPGTRIAVPGPDDAPLDRPIEELHEGDLVLAGSGARAIRHITRRRIDVSGHPTPLRLGPVRLRAGSLGQDLPLRDLVVPQEALLRVPATPSDSQGVLVPAGALANGISILHEPAAGLLTWYSIVLDEQDLILAENIQAATPRGAPRGGKPKSAAKEQAADLLRPILPGPELLALRNRLYAQAERMKFAALDPSAFNPFASWLADDSAHPLRLFANGDELEPDVDSTATRLTFILPAGTGPVRLLSRAHESPSPQDTRRLGVCVVTMEVDGTPLDLEGPLPGRGFHSPEGEGGVRWRWTDGNAWLVLPHHDAPKVLTVHITDWHHNLRPARG
jgi:Hint domain